MALATPADCGFAGTIDVAGGATCSVVSEALHVTMDVHAVEAELTEASTLEGST